MMAALANWRMIGALGLAALVALASAWALVERAERKAFGAQLQVQTDQLDHAVAANAGLVDAIETLRVEHERQIAAIAAEQKSSMQRAQRAQGIKEGIRYAPPQDDGPVAPVLSAVVERLRRPAPIAGNGEGGQAQPAAQSADLPGKP